MIKIIEKTDEKYILEIIRLEKKVFGENGAIDIWNLKPYIKYGKVFVYLKNDTVIAVAELIKDWEKNKAYLYGLCVDFEYRSQGVGEKLMREIFEYLNKENITLLELTVSPENKNAIKFYEKLNFEKIEYIENEYGENNHRYLFVKKIL